MVVYSCAWPLLLNTIAAVKQVDPLLIKSARTMGASPQQLFRKVILPAALPTIFVGIRLASASAMLVLVASEMVGAKAGLGYLIIYSQYSFLIPQMYFGILGITVIGLTFNALLEALEGPGVQLADESAKDLLLRAARANFDLTDTVGFAPYARHVVMARAYFRAGRDEEARASTNKALELAPDKIRGNLEEWLKKSEQEAKRK